MPDALEDVASRILLGSLVGMSTVETALAAEASAREQAAGAAEPRLAYRLIEQMSEGLFLIKLSTTPGGHRPDFAV
jgi:hypothetical protein